MSRRAFLAATDRLIDEGTALAAEPEWERFRAWLLESDRLLESVWGRMDRYHLAWLMVGIPFFWGVWNTIVKAVVLFS